jgi:hypothetical protein
MLFPIQWYGWYFFAYCPAVSRRPRHCRDVRSISEQSARRRGRPLLRHPQRVAELSNALQHRADEFGAYRTPQYGGVHIIQQIGS